MLLAAAVAVSAFAVHRALRGALAANLCFDGQHWSLSSAGARPIVAAAVALDLQSFLLVRLQGAGTRSQWCWLERRADPLRWNDVRRALHARLPSPAGGAAPALP